MKVPTFGLRLTLDRPPHSTIAALLVDYLQGFGLQG